MTRIVTCEAVPPFWKGTPMFASLMSSLMSSFLPMLLQILFGVLFGGSTNTGQ